MIQHIALSKTFREFLDAERAGGALLVLCTALSIALANSPIGQAYVDSWHASLGVVSVERFINDALMAVFFLLIGLELERELYVGELSEFRNALVPAVAAAGGAALPALIHFSLNAGTPAQAGVGIPMATDIAFALGVLALLGARVPASLKVFLAALAVMDDLIAVVVIAVFYTAELSSAHLLAALGVFGFLLVLNRLRVLSLVPYLAGGAVMWYFMFQSGVHATITGVLLAFAIPFTGRDGYEGSPSHRMEHFIQRPVAFIVLPVFALANTAIVFGPGALETLTSSNSLGIIAGLLVGKPAGIALLTLVAVSTGLCRLPEDLRWRHIFGVGLLGGIGFTMSIFVANLAFIGDPAMVSASKVAVLFASVIAGFLGWLWLRIAAP